MFTVCIKPAVHVLNLTLDPTVDSDAPFRPVNSVCCVSLQKKSGVLKSQEKKERWKEKKGPKRQKREDEESAVVPVVAAVTAVAAAAEQAAVEEEEAENVQPAVDPLENGFLHHAQREQERMNERLLKRTYSKKNKTVSPHRPHFVRFHRVVRQSRSAPAVRLPSARLTDGCRVHFQISENDGDETESRSLVRCDVHPASSRSL